MGSRGPRLVRAATAATLAGLAGILLLHTPPARSAALAWLVRELQDRAGVTLEVQRLEYNLFARSVRLVHVRARPARPSGTGAAVPFFEADLVEVRFGWAVFRGRVAADALRLAHPRLTVVRAASGDWNLPALPLRAAAPASPTRLPLGRLTVDEGAAIFRDDARGMHVAVEGLRLELRGEGADGLHGPLEARGTVAFERLQRETAVRRLAGRIRVHSAGLDVETLVVDASEGVVELAGRLEGGAGPPRVDVSWRGAVDAGRLAAWWPTLGPVSGALAVGGRLVGPLAQPTAAVQLAGGLAGGRVIAVAQLALGGGLAGTAAVDYEGIDLERLVAAARLEPPLRVAASLDGEIAANWSGPALASLDLAVDARARRPTRRGSFGRTPSARPLGVTGQARLRLERGRWRLDHALTVGGAVDLVGEIEASAGAASLAQAPIAGRLAVRAADLARVVSALEGAGLEVSAVRAAALRGSALARLELAGTLAEPRAEGVLKAEPFETVTSLPAVLEARLVLDRRGLDIGDLSLRSDRNRLAGSLRVSFVDGALAGAVAGAIRDPSAWLRLLPAVWRPAGRFDLTARLGGRIDRPTLAVDLAGDGVAIAGAALGHVEASALVASDGVEIPRFEAVQPENGRVALVARYDFRRERCRLRLQLTEFDLAPAVLDASGGPRTSLEGRISGVVTAEGTWADPRGRARLALEALRWQTIALGGATLDLDLAGGRVTAHARAPELGADGWATVKLAAPHRFTLVGRVAEADLARFWPGDRPRGLPVAGRATLAFEAAGALDHLAASDAEIAIEAFEASVGSARVTLARPARLRYAGGALGVAGLELVSGTTRVGLGGSLVASGSTSRLAVMVSGDLQDLTPFLPPSARLRMQGALRADLVAAGDPTRPTVAGDLSVTGGSIAVGALPPVRGVELHAALRDGTVEMPRFEAEWQGARVSATGRFPLVLLEGWLPDAYRRGLDPSDRAARLAARIDGLAAGVLAPWIGADRLGEIGLDAAAELALETDALARDRLRGTLAFDRLALSVAKVPLEQVHPTRIVLESGRLRVADWRWAGPAGDLALAGEATLGDAPRLEAGLRGRVALRAIGAFLRGVQAGGFGEVDVRVAGGLDALAVSGAVELAGAELLVATPRVVVTGVTGRVEFDGDRVLVRRVAGEVNGGRAEMAGELVRDGWRLAAGELAARVQDAAFEWPRGLHTEIDADLALRPAGEEATLAGRIVVARGAYRQPLVLTEQLIDAWRGVAAAPAEATWLDRLRLDLSVRSEEAVVVDNNYGRFAARLDLRVGGTAERPGLSGRVALDEGGRLYLGGHVYRLERGAIDFVDPSGIEPVLDVTARARVSGYDVTLSVRGTPGAIEAELASDPPLAPGDILALLLTGQAAADISGAASPQVREQMLAYLSGDLLALAGTRVGFDVVRLERGTPDELFGVDPALVAAEVDPAARLSLTKRLGERVEVVLSQNLRAMGRLTWIALYRSGAGIELRGLARDDASLAVEVSQRLALGQPRRDPAHPAPSGRRAPPRVAAIRLELPPGASEQDVRARLSLRVGARFDVERWQRDRERLEADFRARGYLEARVRAERTRVGDREPPAVELGYHVQLGPATEIAVRGHPLSTRVRRAIEAQWAASLFDEVLAAEVREIVREALAREGYLQARVTTDVQTAPSRARPERKTLAIEIEPGPRTNARRVEFRGNQQIARRLLEQVIRTRGLAWAPWLAPTSVDAALTAFYAGEGFLAARVATGSPRLVGGTSVVPVTIEEGRRFTVAEVRVVGARGVPEPALRQAFRVAAGSPYRPAEVDEGRRAVEAAYRRAGYARARVRVHPQVDTPRAQVAVLLEIDEGPRQVIGDVHLVGAQGATQRLAARALRLGPGQPASPDAWAEARRRLYETGVFRSADVRFERLEPTTPGAEEAVRALVTLEPYPPYRLRYGVRLGDEAAPAGTSRAATVGVTADLERRQLFGHAVTAGLTARYEPDRALARAFARLPRLGTWPVETSAYLTRSHETVAPAGGLTFVTDRTAVTAQQAAKLPRAMRVTYGYSFERNHVFDPQADPRDPFALDYTVVVGRLTTAWVGDTRDDPFDPTRGVFAATSVEYASRALGSDLRFVKWLFQASAFRRTGPVVLAGRARLGAARGFGQEVVPSERFFAGGGSSVRGYPEDALGPVDLLGEPTGGNALFVLNSEVRFPIAAWVRGVAFVDAGNVFSRVADLGLRGLAVGVGLGLRVDTPVALLRVDFGVPLPRRPDRPFGRWYFSLGHVF